MNYYSWIKSPYPRLILKYEDLKKNEFENFKKILKFIGQFKEIEINDDKIKQTIEKCNFQKNLFLKTLKPKLISIKKRLIFMNISSNHKKD